MNFKYRNLLIAVCVLSVAGFTSACKKGGADISDAGNIIKTLETIHFDLDQSTIRSDAVSVLKRNADWLSSNSKGNVVVEGHCDERGTNEYNLALGERRALSTKSYLVNLGVPNSRISTISYGEERPVDQDASESAWARNRRAETLVKK